MLLYKYYPCNEFTFNALAVPALWCHYPANMNDPFECLRGVNLEYEHSEVERFKDIVRTSSSSLAENQIQGILSMDNDSFIEFEHKYRQKLISEFAFCSLSEKPDDVLMWSHYADAHTGCVLGIDIPDNETHLKQVIYDEAPVKLDLEKFAHNILEVGDNSFVSDILQQISVKGPMWRKEREWRIWRRKPGYYKYGVDQIKEIYFGVNCPPTTKLAVSKILNELDKGFLVNEMEVSYNPLKLIW